MASSSPPEPPPPAGPSVAELSLGEQLMLWAVRKRLEGEAQVPTLRRGFQLADRGPRDDDAFDAFEQLFGAIGRSCRRDLWFHRCGCGCVSDDELTILGLVAAEQGGDLAAALLFGRSLVAPAGLIEVLHAARRLALALAERGLALPLRRRDLPRALDGGSQRLH